MKLGCMDGCGASLGSFEFQHGKRFKMKDCKINNVRVLRFLRC